MKLSNNFKDYRYIVNGNEVIAISSFAGHTVKGKAKCHPNDNFSIEIGKQLAAARCGRKIAEKRYKRAQDKYKEVCKAVLEMDKTFKDSCDYLANAYGRLKEAHFDEEEILKKIYG